MKVGVLSDTHDRLPAIREAVERFNAEGVELVLHAGDFVSPFVALALKELRAPLVGVFGNNDGDPLYLIERLRGIGEIHLRYHTFEVDGLRAVLMHEPKSIDALVASGHYDLIVYGHTHEVDLRPGRPTVINPGEGCGWLSGRPTAVVFDTAARMPRLIELKV